MGPLPTVASTNMSFVMELRWVSGIQSDAIKINHFLHFRERYDGRGDVDGRTTVVNLMAQKGFLSPLSAAAN